MNFQWYPGHMTKAVRMMKEDMKLIDLVIEILDARLPFSSRNPDIDELGKNKARLILLNKSDLADERWNNKWTEYFKEKGYTVVKVNSRNRTGIKEINTAVNEACKEKIERDRRRGIKNRPIRAMVVGIPNVGKSTFINAYAGKACTKTGNKPGVTKGKQWIKLNKNLELLDTPGILWPKFDDQLIGLKLAVSGSINDNILNTTDLAYEFIKILKEIYPNAIAERYGFESSQVCSENAQENREKCESKEISAEPDEILNILNQIAEIRGCKLKGNLPDIDKAALILLDDFRSGKLGRITLDTLEA